VLRCKPHLVQVSKAIGSKPAVFDDLEVCLWKIVVEGPTDLSEQLGKLKALYSASMEEANRCRGFFLQAPSTSAVEDSIAEDSSSGERSMYAENSALAHDTALQQPLEMAVDEVAVDAVQDTRPPSDTSGDAAMDVSTSIVENGGRTTTPRDPSSPAIAVHEEATETDPDITIDDAETASHSPPSPRPTLRQPPPPPPPPRTLSPPSPPPRHLPNPRPPRRVKLVINPKPAPAKRAAAPTTPTIRPKAKRRRLDRQDWRSIPAVAGEVSHSTSVLDIRAHSAFQPERVNDLQSDHVRVSALFALLLTCC
jgi:hypothetical protein